MTKVVLPTHFYIQSDIFHFGIGGFLQEAVAYLATTAFFFVR